ncbi:MAG TPA: N-acetylmuramoyl-L-alanine amidase, partial [Actinomycetota bacterium]|nr:N-acetylmuramoyl-L-alanine amidase [Actinomycetota bacterium]
MRAIRPGDRGDEVADVQTRLASLGHVVDPREVASREFGPSTEAAIRAFQQERSLLVDALVGPATWQELVEASYSLGDRALYLRSPAMRGDDVRALQDRLDVLGFDPGRSDGIFGAQTDSAVRDFQRNVGMQVDGIVGATTIEALARLRPPGPGPGRANVRESESLRASGSLSGRTVAIDPGHGPGDPGGKGPSGSQEHELTLALSRALSGELRSAGGNVVLLREAGEDPGIDERVERTNASDADALISLHLNSHSDPGADGASVYYFGRLGTHSVLGQRLAELVLNELTARLDVRDGRTHPKGFALLRETPMPAIQVEPCFISNPEEERRLGDEGFRLEVARAI